MGLQNNQPDIAKLSVVRKLIAIVAVGVAVVGAYQYAYDCAGAGFYGYLGGYLLSYVVLVWVFARHGWLVSIVRALLLLIPFIVVAGFAFAAGFARCFTF